MPSVVLSLVPEVVVEPVPGGQLAPGVDQHGGGRRAVLGQLPVILKDTLDLMMGKHMRTTIHG